MKSELAEVGKVKGNLFYTLAHIWTTFVATFQARNSFDCHLRYSSFFFKGLLQCFIDLGQVTTALTHVDGVVTRRFVETVTQMKSLCYVNCA